MTNRTRGGTIGFLLLLSLGCATAGKHPTTRPAIDRQSLLNGPPELAAPDPKIDILALDDEMRAYLLHHVPKDAPDLQKARLLLQSFFATGGIRVQYNSVKTGTAMDTFHAREVSLMTPSLRLSSTCKVSSRANYIPLKRPQKRR